MRAECFTAFLQRRRVVLFAAWLVHALVLHGALIGFISWDGLCYRLPPVIELIQHGRLGLEKFNEWAYAGYVPFVELAHVPFVWLFGLTGTLIGYPLVVFPLCVAAVYAFVRELTGDDRCAVFGGLAYLAMPMINQQPFAGYIDFVVVALLAFFAYALLRVRSDPPRRAFLRLLLATGLFTLSRAQGVYVAAALVAVLSYVLFAEREGLRVRLRQPRALLLVAAATALGAIPAIGLQVWRYVTFGSPVYPLQFRLLGFTTDKGLPLEGLFTYAGVKSDSAADMGRAFVDGWLWHGTWPIGGFFDSRFLGAGLVLVIALILLPVFLRKATRVELVLVGVFVLLSLLARDYVHPRYAYTLTLTPVVVIARAMVALLDARRGRVLFWAAAVLLLAHLLRPELDIAQLKSGGYVAPRLNVAMSPLFLRAQGGMRPFPDVGATFVIIEKNNFIVPLYGHSLSNRIAGTVPAAALGTACAGLAEVLAREPEALFIDEKDLTRDCRRECGLGSPRGVCRAYRIEPGP